MQHDLLKHLDDAVAEIFSQMLSRSCAPAGGPCDCVLGPPELTASVQFSGTMRGACAVSLDPSGAGELACELTGECISENSQLTADTVAELCNMIAGSWKSRLAPSLSACKLSAPEMKAILPGENGQHTCLTRYYHFAQHCLMLQLSLA